VKGQRYLVLGLVGLGLPLLFRLGLVGLALWLMSRTASNKYRCEYGTLNSMSAGELIVLGISAHRDPERRETEERETEKKETEEWETKMK